MVDVRPVVALPSRVHDVHVHQGRTVASLHHLVAHLEKIKIKRGEKCTRNKQNLLPYLLEQHQGQQASHHQGLQRENISSTQRRHISSLQSMQKRYL